MMYRATIIVALLAATAVPVSAADCSHMRRYAQAAANDMARRNSMDHSWFHRNRMGRDSGGAENVGVGYKTKAQAMAGWWSSPSHAANLRRQYRCTAVASARSRSGRLFWAWEGGQ